MTVRLTALVHKEGEWYVSHCPELDIASQGRTVEESVDNLREAVELYLEDQDVQIPDSGMLVTTIEVAYERDPPAVST